MATIGLIIMLLRLSHATHTYIHGEVTQGVVSSQLVLVQLVREQYTDVEWSDINYIRTEPPLKTPSRQLPSGGLGPFGEDYLLGQPPKVLLPTKISTLRPCTLQEKVMWHSRLYHL